MKALLLAGALTFAVNTSASAATIIFDVCEPMSQCSGSQLTMWTWLTASNDVQVYIFGPPEAYGDSAFGINLVDPSGVTISELSTPYTLTAAGPVGPFGEFDIVFDGPPFRQAWLAWSFVIDGPDGFTNDWEVFDTNPLGFYAAATLFRSRPSAPPGDFFFAAADQVIPPVVNVVPEPGSLLLLGTGLLAAYRARRPHS